LGLRARHDFNAANGRLQEQNTRSIATAELDRRADLRVIDNGNGPKDFTVAFTFSLKPRRKPTSATTPPSRTTCSGIKFKTGNTAKEFVNRLFTAFAMRKDVSPEWPLVKPSIIAVRGLSSSRCGGRFPQAMARLVEQRIGFWPVFDCARLRAVWPATHQSRARSSNKSSHNWRAVSVCACPCVAVLAHRHPARPEADPLQIHFNAGPPPEP